MPRLMKRRNLWRKPGSKATDFDALLSGGKHKQKTAMDFIVDGETTVSVKIKGTTNSAAE
jgi:hypothetical protein